MEDVSATSYDVLIVDDDITIRAIARDALTRAGFTVRSAINGRQALELLSSRELPRVIVLDRLMPQFSGDECIALLRRHPTWGRIPVIILSILSGTLDGAAAVLPKPLRPAQLVETVRELCATSQGEPEAVRGGSVNSGMARSEGAPRAEGASE